MKSKPCYDNDKGESCVHVKCIFHEVLCMLDNYKDLTDEDIDKGCSNYEEASHGGIN